MIGSTAGGRGLDKIAGLGSGIIDYHKGAGGGNTDWLGNFKIDPTEFAGGNASGVGVYYDTSTGSYYDSNGKVVPIQGDVGE